MWKGPRGGIKVLNSFCIKTDYRQTDKNIDFSPQTQRQKKESARAAFYAIVHVARKVALDNKRTIHTVQSSTLMQKSTPSKHARSDSHPVRIGLKALARSGLDDSCTLVCFRTGSINFGANLTQSARTKSDPRWFCTILSGTSVEE